MRWGVTCALVAGVLWGLTYPLTELALSMVGDYVVFTAELYSIMTLIGILHVLVRKRDRLLVTLSTEKVLLCLLLAVLNVVSIYLFYVGVEHVDIATLAFTVQLYPVLTMFIDCVLNGNRVTLLHVAALLMYIAGLACMTCLDSVDPVGVLAGLGIALVYVMYILIYNRMCNSCDYTVVNLAIFTQTALVANLMLAVISRSVSIEALVSAQTVMFALAVVVYLCYVLEALSHRELPPTIVAFALSLEPITASVIEYAQKTTHLSTSELLGAVLILLSIYLVCRASQSRTRTTIVREGSVSKYMAVSQIPELERIKQVYNKMLSLFYRLEDEITGIFIALLSRENYILIGPPGTGKTTLIYTLSKLLNAKWFYRQLTKFTDLEEILGPIDIAELLKGRVVRIYANSIVEADLALLDEIFNASSAILNTLLSILNERVVYDGDKVIPVRTWTVYASSNRIPEEEELQALYDRFPLRSFLNYVTPEETEPLIVKGWQLRKELDNISPLASMDDVRKCHDMLLAAVYDKLHDLAKHIAPIVASFVEHVQISNRTRVKTAMYVLAYIALTTGKLDIVDKIVLKIATLKVLKYLVSNRDQLNEYYTFVKAHMPEEFSQIYELLNEARALVNNLMFDKAREKIEEAELLLTSLKTKWGDAVLQFFKSEIEEIENTLAKLREAVAESSS